MSTVLHKLYRRAWPSRWGPIPLLMATMLSFLSFHGFGQTTIVGPLNGGNFELGGSYAANNWTLVNTTPVNPTNQWQLSTLATGAAFTGNRAFASKDAGVTYTYDENAPSRVSFYRDVTFPAGETIITLSFVFRNVGEAGYDGLNVSLVPTSTTILSNNSASGSTMATIFGTPPAGVLWAGQYNITNLTGASGGATGATVTFSIPASMAGTTQRLVFTWRNDSSVTDGQPPAAVDDILLTSALPSNFNSSAQGGLWSSPASWAGGVVPASGNDITIVAGSHIIQDFTPISYRNLTVNGTLTFGQSVAATVINLTGDLTVGATGMALLSTAAVSFVNTVNVEGNVVNNGVMNATAATLNWPTTVVGNRSISGTGTFVGVGGNGVIRALQPQNLGNFTVSTTQNLTVNAQLVGTCNNLITNNKLFVNNATSVIDNTVQYAVVTNMGTGYTTAPVVFGTAVSPWVASGAAVLGTRYRSGTNVYQCTTAGTFDPGTPPANTTPALEANGTANVIWIGNLGNIGNPLPFTAASTAGTQYFCGNNLYTCTIAGTASAAAPPTHVTGTAASGTATYAYVGSVAKVTLNHDGTNNVVRSASMASNGSGYASTPAMVVTNTGAGSGAAITASMWNLLGATAALGIKASAATITGTIGIQSSAGPVGASVGQLAGLRGGYYLAAPTVGFSAPGRVNLVTAQGTGYTGTITVTVAGGTLISGAAIVGAAAVAGPTVGDFTVNIAEGRVISVYCNAATTKIYSVPPTVTITTSGGGAGATLDWGTAGAAWPTATANLNANGQVDSYTVTNAGYGYVSTTTPVCALSTPAVGEVAAGAPTSRMHVYSAQQGFFTPQSTNPYNTLGAFMPTNNRLAAITSTSGLSLGASTEIYADAPLTLTSLIDLGGFTLTASSYSYAGVVATVNGMVFNGSVQLTLPGGQATATRTFPLGGGAGGPRYGVYVTGAGAALLTGGYTFTGIRATTAGAPSGTVSPAGNMTGTRTMRLQMQGSGTLSNTNALRTFQLFWNNMDNLVSDNPSIFVAEAAAVSGPYTVRSTTTGSGSLPAAGSRTTATGAPGPISNASDVYFGFANNGFATPPGIAYNVTRLTGQTYNSIVGVAQGGDGTGLSPGFTLANTDDQVSPVISLVDALNAFTYQGQTVTGFLMSTNGNLQLQTAGGATASNQWANGFNDAALLNVVAPFWDDLTCSPDNDLASQCNTNMKYKITGTAPTRVVTMEWVNMTCFGLAGPQLAFQVVMTEATNSIRINYGDMQAYNGTQNVRYSYSQGLKGRFTTSQPSAGQIFACLYENTDKFSHEQSQLAGYGAGGLCIAPDPHSSLVFTPGVYPGYTIPVATAPVNDNVAGAIIRPSLSVFPTNIAWDYGTGTSNLFTSRYATHSPQPVCGGPATGKDVWFQFNANEVNVTARVYASGGYIARVEVLDAGLTSLVCNVGSPGGQTDAIATGLTIGQDYYVRVCHDLVGTAGVFTGNAIVAGTVTGVAINNGGTNYTVATGLTTATGARMVATGGGANTFVGAVTGVAGGGVINAGGFDGGYGYVTMPTLTVESPDWGITGEFGIVIYAPPINDNCSGAIALTNINTNSCVTGQNQIVGAKTSSATQSPESNGSCNTGTDDDLWYKFVATGASTTVTVTSNGIFDAAMQFWSEATGNCVGKAVLGGGQACLNATGAGGVETVNLTTTIGTTYFIRIYHANAGSGDVAGFDICITTPVPVCATYNSPTNASTTCATPSTTLDWQSVPFATGYDVYLDAGGTATTLVSSNQVTTSYNAGVLTAGGYAYRIVPRNANGPAVGPCANFTFTVISPSPLTTTPGSRCGIGTVNLSATASGGQTLRWYDAPTGGNLLASGATPLALVTPSISSTTNFYVSAANAIVDNVAVGTGITTTGTSGVTPYTSFWESQKTQYLIRATELLAAGFTSGNMTQLSFDVTIAGGSISNYSIEMAHTNTNAMAGAFLSETFTSVFSAATYTPVLGVNTHVFGTPFNWNGTDNIVVQICNSVNPFVTSSTVRTTVTSFASVYGEFDDGADICAGDPSFNAPAETNARPNMIIRGNALCAGPRVSVAATVTPPPALNLSTAVANLCDGGSTNTVFITTPVGNFNTYTWSPATFVSGTAGAGYTFNPAGSTSYLLTGTSLAGCVNQVALSVVVNPNPGAGTAAHDGVPPVCEGSTINLSSTGFSVSPVTVLTQNFEAGLAGWTIAAGGSSALADFAIRTHGFVSASLYSPSDPGGTNQLLSIPDAGGTGTTTNTQAASPVFSLDGYSTASLSFRHAIEDFFDIGAFGSVQLSTDGGATWPNTLATYTGPEGAETSYDAVNIDLSAFVGNTNCKIRFNYQGGWEYYWAIDDVVLTGTPPNATFLWSGPNLYSAAGQNPAALTGLTTVNSGVYTITATTNKGCFATASTAALNVIARPTVTFTANDFVCVGQTDAIDITFTGTPPWNLQYTDPGAVTLPPQGSSPYTGLSFTPVIAPSSKTYTATALTDASGCAVAPAGLGTLTITVPDPCSITWNGTGTPGLWTDGNNWTPNNGAPSTSTSVIIPGNVTPQPNFAGIVANAADIALPGASTITVGFGGTLNIRGSVTSTAGAINGIGLANFNGTGQQNLTGNLRLNNVTFSNTSGTGVVVPVGSTVRVEPSQTTGSGIITFANNARFTNNGNFIVGSNATATAKIGPVPVSAIIGGNITMERYLPNLASGDGSWYFLGSPITGQDFRDYGDDFTVTGLTSGFGAQGAPVWPSVEPERSTIFKYVEALHNVHSDTVQKIGWRIPGNESVAPGTGYRAWVKYYNNPTHKVTNTGPFFRGNLTFPALTRNEYFPCYPTTAGYNPLWCNEAQRGWNLLANPYPCDIDWNSPAWTKPAQMNNAFFTWNSQFGGYRAYAGVGGSALGVTPALTENPNPSIIPSSQSFFVRVNSAGSFSLSITEAAKTITDVSMFVRTAVADANQLKVGLTRNQDTDGYRYKAMVRFRQDATDVFDEHLDVHNLTATRPSISFIVGNEEMVLTSLAPLTETKVVPVVFKNAGQTGTFKFTFEDYTSFDAGVVAYVKDNFLGTLSEVGLGSYSFEVSSVAGSYAHDRFELIFNPEGVTGITPIGSNELGMSVYPNPSLAGKNTTIAMNGFGSESAVLTITDVLGRVVFSKTVSLKADGVTEYLLTEPLPSGVYTVKTVGGGNSLTRKLVIK